MAADDFPKRLKKWRGKLTQKEAAGVLNVSLRTYQFWEAGTHAPAKASCGKCVEERIK